MQRQTLPQIRSLFFTPGNNKRKVERVFDFGADAVNLDRKQTVLGSFLALQTAMR